MKNNLAKITKMLAEQITGKIFAVFCIALVQECDWKPEDARYLCECAQAYWNEIARNNVDAFKWCEETTGLNMRNFVNRKTEDKLDTHVLEKMGRKSSR